MDTPQDWAIGDRVDADLEVAGRGPQRHPPLEHRSDPSVLWCALYSGDIAKESMLRSDFTNANEYNSQQKSYFERTTKRTMVPVDSRYLQRHVDAALSAAQWAPGERVLEVG